MHGNTSFSSKVLFKEVTSSAHFSTSFCKTPTSVLISCDAFWSASLNETSDDVHSSKTCFSVAVLYTSKGNRFAPMSFTISSGAPSLITYIHHTFHNVMCTLALCAHQHKSYLFRHCYQGIRFSRVVTNHQLAITRRTSSYVRR